MTYRELYENGKVGLLAANIEEAEVEAKNILLYVFNIDLIEYALNFNSDIKEEELIQKYKELIQKRCKHIPWQYIINYQNFCGLDFYVDENVLIPRFDTELLVEKVLSENKNKNIKILDLCTGSGCIAISLKKLGGYKDVTGSDISKYAIETAKKNALKNELEINFIESDMFDSLNNEKYDIIVSNPPYIKTKDIKELMPEVRDYEPVRALDGMEDGLYFYKRIEEKLSKYLSKNGKLYLEIGHDQADGIRRIFKKYNKLEVYKDLAGLDRIVRVLFD